MQIWRTVLTSADGQTMTDSKGLTIGELEAKYFLYRKALKALLLEGRSNAGIEKTLCWSEYLDFNPVECSAVQQRLVQCCGQQFRRLDD